jgi:hypothetical protein
MDNTTHKRIATKANKKWLQKKWQWKGMQHGVDANMSILDSKMCYPSFIVFIIGIG